MAEIFPWQKWSISYLWEHFLVPEHRIPIWLDFVFGFSVAFMNAKRSSLNTYRTKLKLDKEVGGGDLSELCTITYLIAYPYA